MASSLTVSGIRAGQAHRVDGHATVDPARCVALIKQVRQRRQHEAVGIQGMEGDALRLRAVFGDLALGDPAGQIAGQAWRVEAVQRGAQGGGGEWAMPARVEHLVQDVRARLRDLQRLGQQIAVVVDHHAPRPQDIGERVVLSLGPAHPEHVVEEQVGGVVRGEALKFQIRAVQYHLPQAADLGIHVEHGTPALDRSCPPVISRPRPSARGDATIPAVEVLCLPFRDQRRPRRSRR